MLRATYLEAARGVGQGFHPQHRRKQLRNTKMPDTLAVGPGDDAHSSYTAGRLLTQLRPGTASVITPAVLVLVISGAGGNGGINISPSCPPVSCSAQCPRIIGADDCYKCGPCEIPETPVCRPAPCPLQCRQVYDANNCPSSCVCENGDYPSPCDPVECPRGVGCRTTAGDDGCLRCDCDGLGPECPPLNCPCKTNPGPDGGCPTCVPCDGVGGVGPVCPEVDCLTQDGCRLVDVENGCPKCVCSPGPVRDIPRGY